jgi:hypothetical protein
MIPPRLTFRHMVAVVELTCGVVAAAWLILLGIEAEVAGPAGPSLLDRSFPFLPGAAVGVGLAWMAVRSWRAANKEARQPAGPAPPQNLAAPAPSPARRAPDPLSPDGARELARAVAVLASAGVLAPHAPEPEQLREAVADHGEPVTADVVLAAMAEADWFRPSFRVSEYPANLAFHDSHGEQLAEVLRAQVEDIVRLAAGGLAGVSAVIEIRYPEDAGPVATRIRLADGGAERVLDYAGAAKYLSTVLHVSLARVLHERGTGRRLAWLWSDQGVWLSGLRDGGVDELNAALGRAAGEGWEWVDEQPPIAAGDPDWRTAV